MIKLIFHDWRVLDDLFFREKKFHRKLIAPFTRG